VPLGSVYSIGIQPFDEIEPFCSSEHVLCGISVRIA
jgi:hypothetical protein